MTLDIYYSPKKRENGRCGLSRGSLTNKRRALTKEEGLKYDEFNKALPEREARLAYARWKCINDLFFLGYEVLGLKNARVEGKKLVDPLFHRWLCKEIEKPGDHMILVFRRAMKSTWAKVRVVQLILENPMRRIALHSVTTNLVRKQLRSIVKMFQTPYLRLLFPDIIPGWKKTDRKTGKPDSWEKLNQDQLILKWPEGMDNIPQESQIEVYGCGSTVTGGHYDFHILDDILNEDSVRTLAGLQKVEEFYEFLQGLSEPHTRELILGTPYHHSDLYRVLRDGGKQAIYPPSKVTIQSCWRDSSKTKPVYKYFTKTALEKIRRKMSISQGIYTWSCQWEVNPVPKEDQIFPPPHKTYDVLPEITDYYIAIDPASTIQTYSDQTGVAVIGIGPLSSIYVVDCFGIKKEGEEIAQLILRLNEQYKPKSIGIEAGLQAHLLGILNLMIAHWEAEQNRKIHVPIIEIKPNNRVSKFERINLTLGSWYRAGKVSIKTSLRDLMNQMTNLTPNYQGKDDLVDALAMTFQLVENLSFNFRNQWGQTRKSWFTMEEKMREGHKKSETWSSKFAV